MGTGDKSWMNLPRITEEYIHGVDDFLNEAFERASQGNEILCPCKTCFNRSWRYRNVVEDHLFEYGFVRGYTKWVFHGEMFSSRNKLQPTNDDETSLIHGDIDKLLHDTFKNVEDDLRYEEVREGPSKKETVLQKDMFMATRARKPGRSYKVSDESITSKIAETEEIETQATENGQSVDAFAAVMGPKHPGSLRLYGRGVTKTNLRKRASCSASNAVQQIQQRMRKMEKQIEEQKKIIKQEVIADVIAQLQLAGLIDPNILAALAVPSPRESTTQATTRRNNQGGEIEKGNESDKNMT